MKLARIIAILILASVLAFSGANGQSSYRSVQSGNWDDVLTWECRGETWGPPSSPPTGSENIVIRYGHTVTLSQNITVKSTTIDSGGELVVSNGYVLTVEAGVGGEYSVRTKNRVTATEALRARSSSPGLWVYGTLTIKGGISASQLAVSLYPGSSVVYSGSSHQTIAPLDYGDLQLDNPANASLSDNTTVEGNLNVTRGNLTTGSYTLTLAEYGHMSETAPFAVLGILYSSRTCSSGINQNYGGMGVEIMQSFGWPTISVQRTTGVAPTVAGATSVKRYFDISAPTGLNAGLVFHYASNELNGADESALQLYKSSDGGSTWSNQGGTVNTSSHSITLSGINSFSSWTAASIVPIPTLINVSPASGSTGSTLNLILTGTNFGYGSNTVTFTGTGITVNSVTVNSSTQITANITIGSSAPTGPRDVSVLTSYGTATLASSFSVGNPLPTLTGVLPSSGSRGQSVPVTLQGNGFVTGVTSVSFGDSITVSSVTIGSPTSLTAQIDITRGASLGARSVSVTNSAPGGGTATLPSAFTVNNPVPTLSSVLPSSGIRGTTLSVTLQGTGFFSGVTSISFGDSISVSSLIVVNPTTLTAQLTIKAGAAPGIRGISVTNVGPGGGTSTLPAAFAVANPAPTITSVAPTSSLSGQTLSLTVTGANFFAGQTSVSLGAGITVNSTTVNSRTQLSLSISISSATTGGLRDVTVTNASPGGGSATLTGSFSVINPPPTLTSLSATTGARGKTLGLLVNGSGFVPGATTMSFGSGVTVTSLTVSNPSQLFADISIARDAALGSRDVTVTNALPGGGTQTRPAAFEVVNPIPTLTSVSPTSGGAGQILSDTLMGSDFLDGASTVSFGSGVAVNSTTVNGAGTQIIARITIAPDAAPGPRNVTVTNPGVPGATRTGAFSITSPGPTVTSIVLSTGGLGLTLNVVVGGTNFFTGITSVSLGSGITTNTVTVNSVTQMTVNISIAPGASIGSRDVVVTNGGVGGGTSTLPAAFSVVYPAPTIASVTPPSAVSGQTVTLTITGTSFISGQTTLNVGAGITVNTLTVNSSTQMSAAISISSTAIGGIRDLTVTNPLPGGGTSILPGGFIVNNPAPTITGVVPGVGARGRLANVTLTGSNFIPGVTIALPAPGLTLVSATFVSATQITGSFFVARDAALGLRDMTIMNSGPGGGTATLAGAFEVQNPLPTVLSASPNTGDIGQSLSVVVTGTDFLNGASSISFGAGISVGVVTVDSTGTHLTAGITIASSATAGSRSVTVTNSGPGGGSATLAGAFAVANPVPTLTSLSTYSAGRGQTLNVTMTGTNFATGVSAASFGVGITVNSLTVSSPTTAIANITIAGSASVGTRSVSVTNAPPGGGTATLVSVFNVANPAPTLSTIAPAIGARGQTLDVVITGTGFVAGTSTLTLGTDVTVNSLTVTSFTQINANITVAFVGAAGGRDVTVTNGSPGGGSALLAVGFTINNPLPTISSVSPLSANRGSIVNVTVTGSQFITSVTSLNFGADIVVNSVVVKSSTEILANITLSSLAASGSRTVTVINASPGGGSANLPLGFTVGTGVATLVEENTGVVPDQFFLQEAYPNPFNPSTRIRFGLPEQSRIKLDIHNMLGNVVAELINGDRAKGFYELQWHADNLPSGVYLIRMYAESLESARKFIASRKAVLVK
ncbi:MAG: T9SS type A sorting domain-containing protein [Ignavibacteriales bacterium]|nr:T9SS type A sorting domain-containing protein [Ignavibacteriales bacterium]